MGRCKWRLVKNSNQTKAFEEHFFSHLPGTIRHSSNNIRMFLQLIEIKLLNCLISTVKSIIVKQKENSKSKE